MRSSTRGALCAAVLSVGALGALSGCQRRPAAAPPPFVTLERGPCFGTCPTYAVAVDARGVVRFESHNRQDPGRMAVDTVGERGVAALRAAAARLRLDTLPGSYRLGEPTCGEGHTDAPVVTLAVRGGARDVQIVDYHGCPNVPPAVREFEQLVDSVAGTARWVQPNRIKGKGAG